MMSFTGSTRGGIAVAKASADTVKRVGQELGGKSANVILDDSDIAQAVTHGVYYMMGNSGQSCNAPDVDTPMLRGEFRDRGLDAKTGLEESAAAVPLNRVCSAEEVAHMVLYACSDSAAFITGYPLVLDGGNRA